MGSRFMNLFWYALLLSIAVSNSHADAEEAWNFEKEEDGIAVFTRAVTGSGIKEFKGIAEVDAPVDRIVRFLQDADGYKDWFPNCVDSKALPEVEDASFRYSVSGTPWPISDRDMILRTTTSSRHVPTRATVIDVSAAPDAYPIQEGLVRIQKASGRWTLEPIADGKTRVTFRMHLEPGGGIPQWLINARVVGTPLATLKQLRASVHTPRPNAKS